MRLMVEAGTTPYPVVVSLDGLQELGACLRIEMPAVSRCIVIADRQVQAHHGSELEASLKQAGIEISCLVVDGGEQSKTIEVWKHLVGKVLDSGVDRSTPIVAFGGGSIGDLAGFVAATVMRGVPLIQVPTTLLSMVDSSVGGKTGLNTRHGKNLVGAFYQPSLVYASVDTLATLSDAEYRSGLGEVVKHAVLGDRALFDQCRDRADAIRARDLEVIRDLVSASVRLKASIVAEDERESGLRAVLNLGHTVGHAIEKVAMDTQTPLPHGVCVGMGLHAEVSWSEREGLGRAGMGEAVAGVLTGLDLPIRPEWTDTESLLQAVRFDKKVRRGTLTTAAVEEIGRVRLVQVDEAEIPAMFHSLEDG